MVLKSGGIWLPCHIYGPKSSKWTSDKSATKNFQTLPDALILLDVVCERLSAMQGLPELGLTNLLLKIPWVLPLKYLRNVGMGRAGQDLALWIWVGLEYTSTSPRTPIPRDLCTSWCVETNRCIPQGYRLVLHVSGTYWNILVHHMHLAINIDE